MQKDQIAKEIADVSAAGVAAASLLEWLPAIAALFTVLWLSIRIWEKITGRDFSTSCVAWLLTASWFKHFKNKP